MSKKDKISASLEKNLPTVKNNRPVKIDKDVKDDYEFSRKTYKDLIYTGTRSMDVLAELARESEHPRAFEVLAQTIKNIGDTTEKLMSLQKKKKDLTADETEKQKKTRQSKEADDKAEKKASSARQALFSKQRSRARGNRDSQYPF